MSTVQEYKKEITEIFRQNTRRGFADWRQCGNLCYEIVRLLSSAATALSRSGRYDDLFEITNRAFIKWGKTNKDDSNGETMSFMDEVENAWECVYRKGGFIVSHKKMLKWFTDHMDGSVIDYLEDYMMRFIVDHFKEDDLQQEKLRFLNERIDRLTEQLEEHPVYSFDIRHCQENILQIYGEVDFPIEDVRIYAAKIQGPRAKEILADIEKNKGNEDEYIRIYQDLSQQYDGGWNRDYKYGIRLKDHYRETGNSQLYKEQLKFLVYHAIGKKDLLSEYKNLFTSEEWPAERSKLFSGIKTADYRALEWFAMEEDYERLMTGVEYGGSYYLKQYEGELAARFPERCRQIIIKTAETQAVGSSNRNEYRKLAQTLRWLKRYPGGSETASELANQYCERYPRRWAMIEELRKVCS
ncbi:MAG: hypothetical protein K5637_02620 [Lachnospiraceae bacterium]|nr:hypothetical protein [Lachnospiraceae bacterium]